MGIANWQPGYADYESIERDVPLSFKYEALALPDAFDAGRTGLAIALCVYEAALLGKAVSYSRSRNFYDKQKRHLLGSYRKVVSGVDRLDAGEWILHSRQSPGGRGWQSSMRASLGLLDIMPQLLAGVPKPIIARPTSAILLRDADGVDVNVRQSREVSRMNRKVVSINEAITSADVRAENGVNLAAPVLRIFNRDPMLMRGGRMYAMGASWQNIPKADRQRVQIDGEPVVEIDFCTLHPAMLYAEVRATLPTDCYDIGDWTRDVVKIGLLTLINATSRRQAWWSLAHNADFSPIERGSKEAFDLAAKLIDDIKSAHQPIAGFFHSDAGARLMRQDSDLAVTVMSDLINNGIVALPVHDSFLVPASKAHALEAAMMRAAHAAELHDIRVEVVKEPAA